MNAPESFLSITFAGEAHDTAHMVLQEFESRQAGWPGFTVWCRMSDGAEFDIAVRSAGYDEDGEQALIGFKLDENDEPTDEEVVLPFWSETGEPVLEIVHVY